MAYKIYNILSIISLLFLSSLIYLTKTTENPKLSNTNPTNEKKHHKPHSQRQGSQPKSDFTGALSAHDLWSDFNDGDTNWAGASTLPDGSHNPNEIVGWGSASASAWTQTGQHGESDKDQKPKPQQQQQQQQMQTQQQQMQYNSGYTAMPQYSAGYQMPQQSTGYQTGYTTGYTGYTPPQQSTGYGYQQPSSGYGYQQPSSGYDTGYQSNGFGYQQPSTGYGDTGTGTGYQTGYTPPSNGYQSSGFSTGYGYSSGTTGQVPGGQQPMGAPGAPAGGGAAGGAAVPVGGSSMAPGAGSVIGGGSSMAPGGSTQMGMGSGIPGGKGQLAPGGQMGMQSGADGGMSSGKCPLPHRHRKPWSFLTDEQKDMFIDGFQQVRKNGKLDTIAQTHAQHDIQNYVHYTSLFTFYHAYMVWELETAIRELGGKFACFTMPYYDWTLDAGKEDDPTILHSGLGADGDPDNNYCITDDETGFTWQPCEDYTPWRTVAPSSTDDNDNDNENENENDNDTPPTDESNTNDNDDPTEDRHIFNDDGGIIYGGYDDHIFMKSPFKAHYITYGDAYDSFDPRDDNDPQSIADHQAAEAAEQAENDDITFMDDGTGGGIPIENDDLVADTAEEACFWTQANCKSTESFPFCCLKRKKSTTVLLPTASEIGDAMYRSKNVKEWQGYLGEYYNKVQALFGSDYYAHMSNGYATEDPIFWMTHSFIIHLRSLWQDCWNYNNIPKDKLDMHYNSYHPYCGTFDAIPDTCSNYNLALDAPMNFYELQKSEWTLAYHKIITVRKMWTPEYWNVVYELGPFYKTSGVNMWCDNTKDSEWFIETMDYNVDFVNTPINVFAQRLREKMMKDSVELTGVYKTVAALSCQYNRRYSKQSCFEDSFLEMDLQKETCDIEMSNNDTAAMTLDDMLEYEGVSDNQCLKKLRRESFAYSEHALQVKKQLCKGDWDYKCPEYNELLYSDYASSLENPVDVSGMKKRGKSFFSKSGWIWMIVINGILVIIVAIGCGIWHCSRSKTANIPLRDENGDIIDDNEQNDINDDNTYGTIQPQDNEEYQPLLV